MNRCFLIILCVSASLGANPKGAEVVSGEVSIHSPNPQTLEIHAGDRAIVNWQDFSIEGRETTHFVQPHNQAAVLNRVTGGKISQLKGLLKANGQVFLLNPQGVLISKEGVIHTASFLASALDLLDEEFLKGENLRFFGSSTAPVVNYGKVESASGDVWLLGRLVRNEGTISALKGHAGLAVGEEIVLKPEGTERLFIVPKAEGESLGIGLENLGKIEAIEAELKADGNAYKLAINQKGVLEATGTVEREGRLYLVADRGVNEVGGSLTAKSGDKGGTVHLLGDRVGLVKEAKVDISGERGGGTLLIGGEGPGALLGLPQANFACVEEDALIEASATKKGDGGQVIVWSKDATAFAGNIQARGGPEGGDGGFIEVSGLKYLNAQGFVDTRAPLGKSGMLLLDPTEVEITNAADSSATFSGGTYSYSSASANINIPALVGHLATTDVIISSQSSFAGTGVINVEDDLSWATDHNLTLSGVALIQVRKNITSTGNGGLTLTSPVDISIQPTLGTNISITTRGGPLAIFARTLTVASSGNNSVVVGHDTAAASGGSLVISTTADFDIMGGAGTGFAQVVPCPNANNSINVGGNLFLQGGTGIDSFAQIGSNVDGYNYLINFPSAGSVALEGGSNTNTYAIIGTHQVANNTGVTGSLIFDSVGDVELSGGTGSRAFAQIGHSGSNALSNFHASGDITFSLIEGDISVAGNIGTNAEAIIGHGNAIGTDGSLSGNISLFQRTLPSNGLPNVLLLPGSGSRSSAIIGFDSAPTKTVSISGRVSLNTNSAIQIDGGVGAVVGAIGYDNPFANATAQVLLHSINVLSTKTITLNAGNGGVTGGGLAVIGTEILAGGSNSAASIVNVLGGNVILNGAAAGTNGKALILNNNIGTSLPLPVNVAAKRNIIVGGSSTVAGSAHIYSSGDLHALADVNIEVDPIGIISNGTGSVILVVDNAFPDSPDLGPGAFILKNGATLNANGPLRIFTALRTQNQINAPINGIPFVPGPEFLDSSTEVWGVYFPSSIGGHPFTIFYKNSLPDSIIQARDAFFEALQEWRYLDHFLFTSKCFYWGRENFPDWGYELLVPVRRTYNLKYADILD